MTAVPLGDARDRLSEYVSDVERTHLRVTIRRRLAADAAVSRFAASSESLRTHADTFADLADPEVLDAAWR